MSFLDRLRKMLAGSPQVQGGDDEGGATALHEEYGTPDEGAADVRRMEMPPGGAVLPGFAASEAAKAAEDDLAEEAPPDSDP